jgi:hypothetical protein
MIFPACVVRSARSLAIIFRSVLQETAFFYQEKASEEAAFLLIRISEIAAF